MPNNEIFSGIPSLDDTQGLENYLNQQTLDNMGLNTQTPAALETNDGNDNQQQTQVQQPTYTNDQIAQIIARNQQLEASLANQQPAQYQQQSSANPYNARQIEIINQLMSRGMTIEQISERLAQARQRNQTTSNVNLALMQRLQNVEAYLQQQEYLQAQSDFEQKMLNFGEKFGLSEDDLVSFGNYALTKGINVLNVTDLESVFRALYPDQYALRVQRINNNSTSQIYGGVNVSETPRASVSKMEDAYVEAFMKQTMPNQYGMLNK